MGLSNEVDALGFGVYHVYRSPGQKLGVTLKKHAGEPPVIHTVREGFAAEAAGVPSYCALVAVDGASTSGLDTAGVQQMINVSLDEDGHVALEVKPYVPLPRSMPSEEGVQIHPTTARPESPPRAVALATLAAAEEEVAVRSAAADEEEAAAQAELATALTVKGLLRVKGLLKSRRVKG